MIVDVSIGLPVDFAPHSLLCAKAIRAYANTSHDGRLPYESEQLHQGARALVLLGINKAILAHYEKLFPYNARNGSYGDGEELMRLARVSVGYATSSTIHTEAMEPCEPSNH